MGVGGKGKGQGFGHKPPCREDRHGNCIEFGTTSDDHRPYGWKGVGRDDDQVESSGTEELDAGGDDQPPDIAEETNNATQVSRSFVHGLRHHIRNSVLDDVRDGTLSSFSVTLADKEFECSPRGKLF